MNAALLLAWVVINYAMAAGIWRAVDLIAGGRGPHRTAPPARPPMTAEDYRQLREWEAGLGWELTEIPAGVPPVRQDVSIRARIKAAEASLAKVKALAEVQEAQIRRLGLPGTCTHPVAGGTYVFTPAGAGPVSCYCGRCGRRIPGQPGQPPRTEEIIRQQIIASSGVPPVLPVVVRGQGTTGRASRSKTGVQASCGYPWVETRPAGMALPVNGEARVCGHPECYPRDVTVTYSEPIEVD